MEARILITEDDANSAFVLRNILQKSYSVLPISTTGEDAVQKAKEYCPDILLMDINIPGSIDGVEAASRILEFMDIPVIYLTGYSDDETINRAKQTAPFGFILKPFSPKEVIITAEMALYKAQSDRQIKATKNKLESTLGSLRDVVVSIDVEGRVNYLNPAAEQHLSIKSIQAEGRLLGTLFDLRNAENDNPIDNPIAFLIKNENPGIPFVSLCSQQDRYLMKAQTSACVDANGKIEGYVIVLRDVTQQYEAEKNNHMMATALESIDDAVLITDVSKGEYHILYVNKGFEKITGYSKKHATNKVLSFLIGSKNKWVLQQELDSLFTKKQPFVTETEVTRHDGKEFLSNWSVAPIVDHFGKLTNLVIIFKDITELRTMEENLRQSQKIEAIGRLAGGIAHDFNNLLSVINSYADLLKLSLPQDSSHYKQANSIREAGKRGASLVSQLMTFSRRDSAEPKIIDVTKVALEIKEMLTRIIGEKVRLEANFDHDILPIKAEPMQIEQVLVNLCVNARDAMPNGGTIQINISNFIPGEHTPSPSPCMLPGNYVLLSVQDAGTGMDSNTLKHIFDPFFTTKEIGKGTGLGLSTVYGIVKQYGGYIDVWSEVGQGSKFNIYLPAEKPLAGSQIPLSLQASTAPTRGTEKILIIQDDETVTDCVSGLLSLHGYIVNSAITSQEAIQRFINPPNIKLLVIDTELPATNPIDLASHFHQANPNLTVLFIKNFSSTFSPPPNTPFKSTTLQKPFPLNHFLQTVKGLLG